MLKLIDVRTAPGSRRHPQFGRQALEAGLHAAGIDYRHEPQLGGFRKPAPDSVNTGWEHPAFRGYADYMATPEFAAALAGLEREAQATPSTVMCAEAQWWRCHRRLIADALTARGWRVQHLGLGEPPPTHELPDFAAVEQDGTVTYPPRQATLLDHEQRR